MVDDNPDDLALFRRAVHEKRWTIQTADSGATGLQKALSNRYDVIVLDYNLGDMTGTEVLLRLKEGGVPTAVLIQSGLGSDFIVARALALGADGYVAKDSATYARDIVAKIQNALDRTRGNQLAAPRAARRETVQEVETVLDDLLERSRGRLLAVGFASPDGFRVTTRFRSVQQLTPETICAMVASATSTCNFLGEGLDLAKLRIVAAEYEGGILLAAPVPGFGILFAAAKAGAAEADAPLTRAEISLAARELTTLLTTVVQHEQYSF